MLVIAASLQPIYTPVTAAVVVDMSRTSLAVAAQQQLTLMHWRITLEHVRLLCCSNSRALSCSVKYEA
jgi:hypothetical protein